MQQSYDTIGRCILAILMTWNICASEITSLISLEKSMRTLDTATLNAKRARPKKPQALSYNLTTWYDWGAGLVPNAAKPKDTILIGKDLIQSCEAVIDLNTAQLKQSLLNPKYFATVKNTDFVYAQKLLIPDGSLLHFWGDLHGDISSLLIIIKRLIRMAVLDETLSVVAPEKNYLIFGGDYVDRGNYGSEIIHTLAILRAKNPHNVFLIRGNHEDASINKGDFTEELKRNFGNDVNEFNTIAQTIKAFYTSLPAVIYVGVPEKASAISYIHCSHGGLELGHSMQKLIESDAHYEIIESLDRKSPITAFATAEKLHGTQFSNSLTKIIDPKALLPGETLDYLSQFISETAATPLSIGYMWSDFTVGNINGSEQKRSYFTPRRGLMYGERLIEYHCYTTGLYQKKHQLVAILRGHQHNPSMPGLLIGKGTPNQSVYHLLSKPTPIPTKPYETIPAYKNLHAINIFTAVATAMYTPSPSVLQIDLSGPSEEWVVRNYYIPNFHEKFQSAERDILIKQLSIVDQVTGAWTYKIKPLKTWRNEVN